MFPPAPNNLNVPLPDPSPLVPQDVLAAHAQPQSDPSAAMNLIAPLFALGASFGGSPSAGGALLKGMHGALADREKARALKQHQDEQMAQQQAVLAETIANHEAEQEAKRQAGIQKLIADTSVQVKGLPKADYDAIVTANEQMGGAFFGLRPNALRASVPYRAPNAATVMAEAGKKFLSNPANKEAIDQGNLDGSVMVDVQDDGIPVPVPVRDVLKAAGTQFDPGTGKPLVMTKAKAAPTNIQPDDEVFLGKVAEFEAEKGRPATQVERGQIMAKVIKAIADDRRATPSGDGGLKDYQKFTAGEKLADKWTKTNTAQREMTRQFSLMQTGLNRFKQGDKNGGAQSVLVTFQKILDPTSVVRESEYARSAAGLGLMSRLEGYVERLKSGGAGVPVADLAAMVETARQFLESMNGYTAGQRKRIGASAKQYGIDPALVFDDLTPDEPPPDTGAGPAVGSVVTLKDGRKVKVSSVNPDGSIKGTVVR